VLEDETLDVDVRRSGRTRIEAVGHGTVKVIARQFGHVDTFAGDDHLVGVDDVHELRDHGTERGRGIPERHLGTFVTFTSKSNGTFVIVGPKPGVHCDAAHGHEGIRASGVSELTSPGASHIGDDMADLALSAVRSVDDLVRDHDACAYTGAYGYYYQRPTTHTRTKPVVRGREGLDVIGNRGRKPRRPANELTKGYRIAPVKEARPDDHCPARLLLDVAGQAHADSRRPREVAEHIPRNVRNEGDDVFDLAR
jgi:hypothetical protein